MKLYMISFYLCNSIQTKENICSFINCLDNEFVNQRVEPREKSALVLVIITANMKTSMINFKDSKTWKSQKKMSCALKMYQI